MSPFSRACFNRLGDAGSVFSALLASATAYSCWVGGKADFAQDEIISDVAVEL
jgi:hypothetical protein